jgi:hypothetical protein
VSVRRSLQAASGSSWHEDEHIPAAAPTTFADVLAGLYSFKDQNLGGELANGRSLAGLTPQCPARP